MSRIENTSQIKTGYSVKSGTNPEEKVENGSDFASMLTKYKKKAAELVADKAFQDLAAAGEHLVTEGIELRCVGVLADKGAALIGNSLGDADNEVRGLFESRVEILVELF